MAKIVPCKKCSKDVEEYADTCVHCGVKRPGVTNKELFLGCFAAIILVLVAVGLLSMCSSDDNKTEPEYNSFENGNLYVERAEKIVERGNMADWELNSSEYGNIVANILANEFLKPPFKDKPNFIHEYGRKIESCLNDMTGDPSNFTVSISDSAATCWEMVGPK